MLNINNNSRYYLNNTFGFKNDKSLTPSVVNKKNDTHLSDDKKVTAVSLGTSVAMILATLAGIKKHKLAHGAKNISMFNMQLREMDILALGVATVTGACIGGISVDSKEHKKAKLRESTHQILANICSPMVTIWAFNKLGDKAGIKIPKIKSKSKLAKATNVFTELLPNLVTSCLGLWSGIQIGNKISNKVTNKFLGKEQKSREVKVVDYCVHIDDPLTILTLADKSGKLKAFTCKTMPFTFILSGYQAGTAKKQ